MRVTNSILEIIDSITMDSTIVINNGFGCIYLKIININNKLYDSYFIVYVDDPASYREGGYNSIEDLKDSLVAQYALGKIKEIDVLNRRNNINGYNR